MGRFGNSPSAVSTTLRTGRIPRRPTMLTTPLCRQLGIEHPILNAPMGGGIAGPELAAAVSNAGGLGTLGLVALPPQFIVSRSDARERSQASPSSPISW